MKKKLIFALIYLSLIVYVFAQNNRVQLWRVLPNQLITFSDENLQYKNDNNYFKYPLIIEGEKINSTLSSGFRSGVVEIYYNNETYYVSEALLTKHISNNTKINLKIAAEVVDIHTPLMKDYQPDDLIKIEQRWNYHAEDYPKKLRKEVAEAVSKMFNAAKKDKVNIRINSAFRSFVSQRRIYLSAIKKRGESQNLVAKPGHSEHQLGTTIDICSLAKSSVLSESFDQTNEGKWLQKNANRFGFYQSYTKENSKNKGYIPEPWHFRYLGK